MTTTLDPEASVASFPAPRTLEEAGLNFDLVMQLVLKMLHLSGTLTGVELAERVGLSFSAIEPVLEFLTAQHQCEISGGAMVGRPSFNFRITDAGRTRATLFLESSHYVGVAPVPLAQYRRYMEGFERSLPATINRDQVREAFSHLVLSQAFLDHLGPAINSRHSMFVYGPPGNGKSVISSAIKKLLAGEIAVPHAIEVEGNIVRLFDPVNHEPVATATDDTAALEREEPTDRRWVRCHRPLVMVGGELTLENLDLQYNETSGFYRMPVQVVANGGVLVIDDFGRQKCQPRDLLNRWIVPLENRVDFLTLQSGQKFDVPFVVLVVFATNIKPAELVDDAFLRRIQYKIFAESPTVDDFIQIFENYCEERGVGFDRSLVQRLLESYFRPRQIPLRGCQPRDLINQALYRARYLGEPERLTFDLLEAACASYFVDNVDTPPVFA